MAAAATTAIFAKGRFVLYAYDEPTDDLALYFPAKRLVGL